MLRNQKIVKQYDFSNLADLEDIIATVNEDHPPGITCTHYCEHEMVFTVFEEIQSDGEKVINIQITQKEI